ncbi:hypothetical protein KUTeg_003692 [Tegillarca granosa]|uniref:Phosphomannomutase n=1 Tax=Tegillarca granosa TaxID=220873 RepID=A0ABQ9FPG8_TEGGR|nr:hypothetical protein KUTeg_003692 [Tegillarca granosa]
MSNSELRIDIHFPLHKIEKNVEDFLEKLKTRVDVALVGGSDLAKIVEQMGGHDDGIFFSICNMSKPYQLVHRRAKCLSRGWIKKGFDSNLPSTPDLEQSPKYTRIGTISQVHQIWNNLPSTPDLEQFPKYTRIGAIPKVHQIWNNFRSTPNLEQSPKYTRFGTISQVHQNWNDFTDTGNSYNLLHYMGEEILQKVINFSLKYMSDITLPAKRGTFVEFRSSMINICPVGRSCSQAERDQFEHHVRQKFVEALRKEFGTSGLKFAIGGQISIDVFPDGWDKTFCLQFIQKAGYKTIHFFGDKTDKGGNDHEIYEDERTIGHKVTSPEDTIQQLEALFFS